MIPPMRYTLRSRTTAEAEQRAAWASERTVHELWTGSKTSKEPVYLESDKQIKFVGKKKRTSRQA